MNLQINSINKIIAIFKKQKKELFRNKRMLIIFIVFPLSMLVLSLVDDTMADSLFLFILMGCIMPPMTCVASEIAEERETGTLRGLIFAGVKSFEYLAGIMLFTGLISFIFVCFMGIILENKMNVDIPLEVVLTSFIAIICSMVIGAIAGVSSKNQVSVSAVIVPISLIILFTSILGLSNETIYNCTGFLYSRAFVDMMMNHSIDSKSLIVMCGNLAVLVVIFGVIYVKRRKED